MHRLHQGPELGQSAVKGREVVSCGVHPVTQPLQHRTDKTFRASVEPKPPSRGVHRKLLDFGRTVPCDHDQRAVCHGAHAGPAGSGGIPEPCGPDRAALVARRVGVRLLARRCCGHRPVGRRRRRPGPRLARRRAHQRRPAHRSGRLGAAADPGVPHGAGAVVRAGLGPGRARPHATGSSASRRSTCCRRTSSSSPSATPPAPPRASWGTSSTSSCTTRACCWRSRARVALCMVVVTSVRKARRRLRYESWHLHPPLRLPRRRPRPAAPAVDRRRSSSPPPPRPSSGGACMPCAPAAVLVFRVGLPLWRSLRGAAARRRRASPRAPASPPSSSAGRGRRPAAACAPASSSSGASSTVRAGPAANPYSLSAAPDGRTPADHRRQVGDGSRAARHAAARHPGARRGPVRAAARRRPHPAQGACSWVPASASRRIRALLEELDQAPGDVVVVHRAARRDSSCSATRCRRLAADTGARYVTVGGHRVPGRDSWLPAAGRPPDRRRGAARRSCPTSPSTTSTSAAPRPGWTPPDEAAPRLPGCPPDASTSSASPTEEPTAMRRITLVGPVAPSPPRAALQLPHLHASQASARPRRRRPRPPARRRRHVRAATSSSGTRPAARRRQRRPRRRRLVGQLARRARSQSSAAKTYTGDAVATRCGDVQVQITVHERQDHRVRGAPGPVERPQGPGDQLLRRADPQPGGRRRRRARTSTWSPGPPYTSQGYIQSLQSAIDQANL